MLNRFGEDKPLAIFVSFYLIYPMGKFLLTIAFLCGFAPIFSQRLQGYGINVTIPELKDSTLFLAYHYGDKQYIKDTLRLDNSGKGGFAGEDTLPQGIYMVVLPGNSYFEVLVTDNQFFGVSTSYPDYNTSLTFSSSPENTAFVDYQIKWAKYQQEAGNISNRIRNNGGKTDSLAILNPLMANKERDMKEYLLKVVEDNKPNLLSALVKSIIPIEIPNPIIPAGEGNPDSIKWYFRYNYNKDHFFDNVDLTDERLLRTPILHSKLETFFTNIVIQSADSINKEIDRLITRCEPSYDIFQYVSVYLFNKYRTSEIMGHDAVVFKIAEDIYLSGKADWVSKEFLDDLGRQVELLRYNLIGLKGKDLVMDSYNDVFVSLYDIEKDFTVLYFWEPSCGHCATTTPKLAEFYENAKNEGVEIFAICTKDDKQAWSDYIVDNKITWINGWDPERISHFDYYYNVQSTPLIYVLDRDKKIIAKKLSVEDLPGFINNYRKLYYK